MSDTYPPINAVEVYDYAARKYLVFTSDNGDTIRLCK